MHKLARLDLRYVWHPFTQMRDWLRHEPRVITRGRGAVLWDARGRRHLDANSSIWTNLHGHNHPAVNRAIERQLGKIAHASALGLANEPSALLAERLVRAAARGLAARECGVEVAAEGNDALRNPELSRVFYSDDGSTAVEVALKLCYEVARRTGRSARPRFLSLEGAYHGDTVGAVSLGHIDLFHRAYGGLLFKSDRVMAPYCYRCPFNRARPERADARFYRRCGWECVDQVDRCLHRQRRRGSPYAGFVFEPLMQGAAGMIPQPDGWLRRVAERVRAHGAMLVADEVMTGFGRTGVVAGAGSEPDRREGTRVPEAGWFACHREGVQPDFLCLAKGMTGGYLPMAATLTTDAVFGCFLGEYDEFKTFYHGHSYTGNPLGAAAALASLDVLASRRSMGARVRLERLLGQELESLWREPAVGDIRRVGSIVGVELVRDWRTREPFELRARAGIRVCEAMARRGVLTRPVGNVVVLMPPYCATPDEVRRMVEVLRQAVRVTFRGGRG
jgi:adenosylmethionine---8-amino-7-oxononanoate aminotransferase